MAKVDREVPWCTVILVVAALTCHSLVLYGNLETSAAMKTIGSSTAGWSRVGQGLARGFRDELDVLLDDIGVKLGNAINQTMAVQKYMDVVISLVGNSTDAAGEEAKAAMLLQGPGKGTGTLPDTILGGVNKTLDNVLGKLTDELDSFLEKIKPALEKAGAMIIKFGDKITQVLEAFSLTLDKVQKMFDQLMAQLHPNKDPVIKAQMIHDTFTLFDVSHSGTITEADLQEVAQIYSISALQGSKPSELVGKYDQDGDKQLSREEFDLFVDDPSIPGAMAVVLRAYATRLAAVAGNVAAAKKRDEVALAVTRYFQLVCAKNRTKLSWVSDTLGNQSLPLPFTADILKNLAMEVDNPDVLTTADVGQVVITEMMTLHPDQVMAAVDLMATSDFWVSEGFDPETQPLVMERVTNWVKGATEAQSLLSIEDENYISAETMEAMPKMASLLAQENMAHYHRNKYAACATRRAELFSSDSSKYLLHHLLGGVAASDGADGAQEAAERAVNAGVPAKPETLQFAQFLSWNASDTANRFQKQSSEYTSTSSSALDSFANNIQGMIKKITSFIHMVEEHATPAGIQQLEDDIHGFAVKAGEDMVKVVNKKLDKFVRAGMPKVQEGIDAAVNKAADVVVEKANDVIAEPLVESLKKPVEDIVGKALDNPEAGDLIGGMLGDAVSGKLQNLTGKVLGDKVADFLNDTINDAIAKAADLVGNAADASDKLKSSSLLSVGHGHESLKEIEELQFDLNGAFDKMATLLRSMVKLLPQATDTMKFAKQEVGQIAKIMDSIFDNFEIKGPAIFDKVASLWSVLWTLYFIFLLPMTLGLLYYGFWASGYFGGPKAATASTEAIEGPSTMTDRLKNCCSACGVCMTTSHDTQLCFWSCIILFEVVCLLIFVISLVLCIFAGIKSFLGAGCAQVYLINDDTVCQQTVSVLRSFLDTFHIGENWKLESVCSDNQLLTCQLISKKFQSSTLYTTVFSFLAAVLSFQMVIESACLHTRARYRRVIDGLSKNDDA